MNDSTNLVVDFERLWASGSSPDLDAFLSGVGAVHAEQLSRLARIDQARRWQSGDRRPAETYLDRYPALEVDHDGAVDLIYHEYLLREKRAEQPTLAEFAHRFPQHAAELAAQVRLHRALADESQNVGADGLTAEETGPALPAATPVLSKLPAPFGRYHVLELLGHGAMGNVYLAEDSKLGRQIALKLPRLDREKSPEAVDRFRREARIAATFHHPNLCPVYDFGEINGTLFLTMPRLSGQPLSTRLQVGPLPGEEAARIALALARAMSVAHRSGVVHCDLKPSNVILREDGEPVIMDFGLARRRLELEPNLSDSGALVGTLAYMAPEQLSSTDDKVSPLSDVYSLGVILYEMLTGRPPFSGSWKEVWKQIRSQAPVAPSKHAPQLSLVLSEICLRALAKDPQDRYGSMDELADALAPLVEPDNIAWRRRRQFSAAAVIAASIVAIAGWFAWQSANIRWATQQAPEIEALARAGKTFEAYDLANRAGKFLSGDAKLTRLLPVISSTLTVKSEPAGAQVYLSRIDLKRPGDSPRRMLAGVTPFADYRIARGDYLLSVEKDGHAPFRRTYSDRTFLSVDAPIIYPSIPLEIVLKPIADARNGMVFVPGGDYRLAPIRRPDEALVKLDDYWIDRCEVTNREYKEFVDAGGYFDEQFWRHAFVKDGRTLSRAEAMREFVDRTGQPGPRRWSNQSFPEGKAEHPVVGITWYEAAAYAAFRQKSLPTIFQWENAARFRWKRRGVVESTSPLGVTMPWGLHEGSTIGRANFGGAGAVAVGSFEFGLSPYGCYDMAGNVAEWCLNETSEGFIASGGSWASIPSAWGYFGIYPGFLDSDEVGFRCVVNSPGAAGNQGAERIDTSNEVPHFHPAPEAEVKRWSTHYDYEETRLDARVKERLETDVWRREKIEYSGANGEQALAYLYLPKHVPAPYQVIHLLPAGAVTYRHQTVSQSIEVDYGSFLRSGRAVFAVVLRGYLERDRPADWAPPDRELTEYLEMMAEHVIDLRRGLDYVQTRNDLDAGRIAYMSASAGGILMALPAIERRYGAAIFVGDGVGKWDLRGHPAVSGINFAPLIGAPKLLAHGRYDESFPLKSVAEPLYNLLQEPKEPMIVWEGAHRPDPEFLVPTVSKWLDREFGAVQPVANQ